MVNTDLKKLTDAELAQYSTDRRRLIGGEHVGPARKCITKTLVVIFGCALTHDEYAKTPFSQQSAGSEGAQFHPDDDNIVVVCRGQNASPIG